MAGVNKNKPADAKVHATRDRKNSTKPASSPDVDICGKCDVILDDTQTVIQCEICETHFHTICAGVCQQQHECIVKFNMHWYCKICEKAAVKLDKRVTALQTKVTKLRSDLEEVKTQTSEKISKQEYEEDITTKLAPTLTRDEYEEDIKTRLDQLKQECINHITQATNQPPTNDAVNPSDDAANNGDWQTVNRQTQTTSIKRKRPTRHHRSTEREGKD